MPIFKNWLNFCMSRKCQKIQKNENFTKALKVRPLPFKKYSKMCMNVSKGQIRPKANWRAGNSPKKQRNFFWAFHKKKKNERADSALTW